VQSAVGLGALWTVVQLLPETMPRASASVISLTSILQGYGRLFRHTGYLIYVAIVAAAYGGLYAWISGSPFALQDIYGLSALMFGFAFAATALGYLVGTLLAAKLVTALGLDRTIVWGGAALCAGGLAMGGGSGARRDQCAFARSRLHRRPGPCHAAGDGRGAHPVSPAGRCRFLAPWLRAASGRIHGWHRGRAAIAL
jgi:hypothetical protein